MPDLPPVMRSGRVARPVPTVVVVGAGIAGLCAALQLVTRGCAVTVLERASEVGGKIRRNAAGAHVIDAGPTVFTLRELFEQIFQDAGSRLSEHLRLRPLETLARHAWGAGETLDLHADIARSAAAIRTFAGAANEDGYVRFCADARRVYETLDRSFLRATAPSLRGLVIGAGLRGLPNLWRLRAFRSLWSALGDYFTDPRLLQLFGRYATYCGSSPFKAPATLMLVAHVEQSGVWQIDGGMHALASALRDLLTARGGLVRCDAEVRRIHMRSRRVRAVELANGEALHADAAIMTCDAAAVGAGLFGPEVAKVTARVGPAMRSLSALTWTARAPSAGFALLRHNVFFSDDYDAEFDSILSKRQLPRRPTVYVCAQDREAAASPADGEPERLMCLVNAPAIGDFHEYGSQEVARCLMHTLATLRRCGLRLPTAPRHWLSTTPSDFHRLFPGSGGALYGQATHGWRASFRRPAARTRIAGLYLAGGSTHPGPGLPMAALSGRHAVRCLLQDQGFISQ